MTDTKQVLLVGGSDADAIRIGDVLRPAGHLGEVLRARGLNEATERLASKPDLLCLVVALEDGVEGAPRWRSLLEQAGLDAPLLALGELSQEADIAKWLAEGAHDWLFRPHLSGLTAVLVRFERERREASDREAAEAALLESQRRFKDLFEHSNDAIVLYRVEPGGRVVCEEMNPACELLSGMSHQTSVGRTAGQLLPPEAAQRLEARWSEAIRTKAVCLYEHELELPAGLRTVNTALVPMLDETGQVYRLAAISRDVTRTREAEALQRSLEAQIAESQKN